jgi:putative chitinase
MNLDKLKGHVPDSVIAQIPSVMTKFKIDTALKLAHFLSQCGHESGGFKIVNENLNYGAKGLMTIFKKYFPDGTKAALYERKPEKIANLVYGGRMGNGPEASGEGFKFRGRGFIQLTGKDNYKAFSTAIGEDCVANPDFIATKYPLASAAWFFTRCLPKCTDASDASVIAVTKCVNGGTIGLEDRKKHFKEYLALLS